MTVELLIVKLALYLVLWLLALRSYTIIISMQMVFSIILEKWDPKGAIESIRLESIAFK